MIDDEVINIIKTSKTIAIVGISSNPEKAAHTVPEYLQKNGFKIIPVNPFSDEILNEKTIKSLKDLKKPVDIIQIFRPSEETPEIVKQAVKLQPKLIWLQLGIENEAAEEIAKQHGVKFVMDHCLMVEYNKIHEKDWFSDLVLPQ